MDKKIVWHSLSKVKGYLDIILTFILVFVAILPYTCKYLPYSKFFKPPVEIENLSNYVRNKQEFLRLEAEDYFSKQVHYKTEENWTVTESEEVWSNLGVVVITFDRKNNVGYLTRTMKALHRHMHPDVEIVLCNADPSDSFPELDIVSRFFQTFHLQKSSNSSQNIRQQEKDDFVGCLDLAMSHLSASISLLLVIEDDAIIEPQFLQVLHTSLVIIEERYSRKQWMDLKLFSPPRWQGFGFDIQPLVDLLAASLGLAIGVEFLLRSVLRRRRGLVRYSTRVCLAWILSGVTLWGVSRQHLVMLRQLHAQFYRLSPAPNCCTPAVLYNVLTLPSALGYLALNVTNEPMDLALSRYRQLADLHGFLIQPNLVRHIGMVSSLTQIKDPLEYINSP